MDTLCQTLRESAPDLEESGSWPTAQLELCGRCGVFEWFLPRSLGGQGWSDADVIRGYLRLSAACLTTTFVITQRTGACRRIAVAENAWPREHCLPPLIKGHRFTTVAISHLTTSRRHLARPVLGARLTSGSVVLDGYSPWVTGAQAADWIVTGATLEDGQQILVAVPGDLEGICVEPAVRLMGLSASHTGPVRFDQVTVPREWILAGPTENVMRGAVGAQSGGLQTSTLAAGLADAAVGYLEQEARSRPQLASAARSLRDQWSQVREALMQLAAGEAGDSPETLRTRANSLVVRATQAALAAAKGAGYVRSHPVERWCREALFFLVWSCPQNVLEAGLRELAGIQQPS